MEGFEVKALSGGSPFSHAPCHREERQATSALPKLSGEGCPSVVLIKPQSLGTQGSSELQFI